MAFNISEFSSSIARNGILRNNKFLVRIPYPVSLSNNSEYTETARYLELWCETASIPGIGINVSESKRYGYGKSEKKPFEVLTTDFNAVFLSDENANIFEFFQTWLASIINYDMSEGINGSPIAVAGTPYEISYKGDYAVDIDIFIFDHGGNPVMNVVLLEAFPTNINEVQLNWGDTNNIVRIPVSFAYHSWFIRK